MVSITLAVPTELKQDMDMFPEINWSAVAREAIKQKVMLLRKFREFTKDSSITGEEALKMGAKVSKAVARRHED
jgi:hypothetical protein